MTMRTRRLSSTVLVLALSAGTLLLGITSSFATAPTISSFSPTSGTIGDKVIVKGSGFTGATAVRFNGATASFTVNSGTKITATVPATASTGKITVVTPGGTASSAGVFTVNPGIVLSKK